MIFGRLESLEDCFFFQLSWQYTMPNLHSCELPQWGAFIIHTSFHMHVCLLIFARGKVGHHNGVPSDQPPIYTHHRVSLGGLQMGRGGGGQSIVNSQTGTVNPVNPLWGHRSISIDSDLGALLPYFMVVMVIPASPFFACMQLNDKRSCWCFEKTFVLNKKLSFWPSEVALPSILAPCSGVVRSSCLCVWFAELEVNGLPALDSSCDLDDSVVWRSIFRSERTLPSWGSLEVCQWPGEL